MQTVTSLPAGLHACQLFERLDPCPTCTEEDGCMETFVAGLLSKRISIGQDRNRSAVPFIINGCRGCEGGRAGKGVWGVGGSKKAYIIKHP